METKKYNSCQACGFDNAANAKYCEKCGTLLGGAWPARGVNRRGIPGSGTRMRWLFVLLPILVIVGLYLVSSVGTSGPASNLFVAGEYVTTNTSNPLFYVNFTIPSGYDGNIYGEFLSNASTTWVLAPTGTVFDYLNNVSVPFKVFTPFFTLNATTATINYTTPAPGNYTLAFWGADNFSFVDVYFPNGMNISETPAASSSTPLSR